MAKKAKKIKTSKGVRLKVVNPDAAGIDIADGEIQVCVPEDRDGENNRRFGSFTCDLRLIYDIYNELEPHIQKSLLARTILRIPLYQTILAEIIEKDVDLTKYMGSLSDTTIGRRSGSILKMINLCLDECRKEGVSYHNLFYPYYKSSTKQLLMGIQEGFDGNSIHERGAYWIKKYEEAIKAFE